MIRLALPWPPSVNRYWRHVGDKTLISAEGRRYREAVKAACIDVRINGLRLPGPVSIVINAFPPDARDRDGDNLFKATLDSLVAAEVIVDDCLRVVPDLRVKAQPIDRKAGGLLVVEISDTKEVRRAA